MFKVKELPFRTVEWLCANREDIDERPVYQRRGKIWPLKDKAFLIDSILNDYDIPKIYLADFTSLRSPLNKRKKRYAIIDGKQRLEAVTEFFDGKLALNKDFQFAADPSLYLGRKTYKNLIREHPDLAQKFRDYKLVIMGVITDEAGKINDLFIRLNRSKPLVGSEVRNAMLGIIPPLIRTLAKHKFFKTRIAFETGRLQDLNAAAKILLLEFRGQFVDTKKAQLDGFVEEFIDEGLRAEPFIDKGNTMLAQSRNFNIAVQTCRKVLNNMVYVFKERDPLFRSQGPLTIYYWFVKEHSAQKKFIRPFLVDFEAKRQENRKRASIQPPPNNLDSELLNFDFLNRSPNDQASCVRRYSILESRFEQYVKQKPMITEQLALIQRP
jgi:hypothetical protein